MFRSAMKTLLMTLCVTATAAVDVKGIVQPVALQGGAEWEDPQSYQAKAIAWLEADVFSQSLTTDRIIQRYAAACIYFATFDVGNIFTDAEPGNWTTSTGWLEGISECSWYGLTCDVNDEVEKINLVSTILSSEA